MKTNVFFLILALGISSMFTSCTKDDPHVEHEEEVITTLTYTLASPSADNVIMTYLDSDGDGPVEPVYTIEGDLKANHNYTGAIVLKNETETPAEDVTGEIEEKAKEHQFFFQPSINGLTVSYDDQDADGNPIGLKTKLATGAAGTGTLKITLRHEPNKSATGVKDGNIANAGGETDIEVSFDVKVQ